VEAVVDPIIQGLVAVLVVCYLDQVFQLLQAQIILLLLEVVDLVVALVVLLPQQTVSILLLAVLPLL
jgi:hypothetical protein